MKSILEAFKRNIPQENKPQVPENAPSKPVATSALPQNNKVENGTTVAGSVTPSNEEEG